MDQNHIEYLAKKWNEANNAPLPDEEDEEFK
jgi:hypothetical protein